MKLPGEFFLSNLLPVMIGNMIGGSVMVAAVYWFVYLRKASSSKTERNKLETIKKMPIIHFERGLTE